MKVNRDIKTSNFNIYNMTNEDYLLILTALELEISRMKEIIENLGFGKDEKHLIRLNNVEKLKNNLVNFDFIKEDIE